MIENEHQKACAEYPPKNLEICFNLWLVVDEQSRLVYSYMGRAYGFRGTREEKLRTLHALSGSDYFTVPKRKLPDRFSCITDEGTVKGVATPEIAHDPASVFWRELLEILSKEIPPQTIWYRGSKWLKESTIQTPIPVPEDPLCVITTLLENELGVMFPQIFPFDSCKDLDKS